MDEKEKFHMQGFLLLKGFFSQVVISELSKIIDPILNQWQEKSRAEILQHNIINMHSLTHPDYFSNKNEKRIQFFISLTPFLLTDLVDKLFGEGIYFHNTQLFFNPTDKDKLPYWHRDLQYSPIADAQQAREQGNLLTLHVRIPLVEEIGLELIPGTHRRWDTELERNVRFEINGHTQTEDLPGATLIPLKPRDILIFSGQMIHRGSYQHNASRKALDVCIGKYHPFTASYLDPHNLPSEEEMVSIPNNAWYKTAKALIPSH